MQKNEQLDIFGNWKTLDRIKLEKKCNEKYQRKILTFKKEYLKNGGVLSVNKAFIKTD